MLAHSHHSVLQCHIERLGGKSRFGKPKCFKSQEKSQDVDNIILKGAADLQWRRQRVFAHVALERPNVGLKGGPPTNEKMTTATE
jgi:hypothetical protein